MSSGYIDLPITGGSGSSGVSSLNSLTGALTLVAGSNITITDNGSNQITIASTGGGSITGLTAGQVPVASSATTLVDSIITATSTAVGIGTNTPLAPLQVNGDVMFLNDSAGYLGNFSGSGITNLYLATNIKNVSGTPTLVNSAGPAWLTELGAFSDVFRISRVPASSTFASNAIFLSITNAGKVGIGTTTPGQLLSVAGTIESTSGGFKFPDGTTQTTASSATGTVTSVALTAPASLLTVSGSPVTTSGTLALALATQAINLVFAGPGSGSSAAPTFRSLVAADIPALPYASSTLANTNILVGNASNVATAVALSGDATLANTGALTVAANAITNAKLAQMAAHTFKGNNTGSTANALDLTATQLTAELNNLVGDSGSGGTKGLAPAPSAGDAAANKYLKADGTWATVVGSGITQLTGDVTAGPGTGSQAATLATVNSNVGTFNTLTVNGKGLVTAASNTSYAPNELTLNTQTSSYTLVLTDSGKLIRMNVGSANTLTIPPNGSVAFPTGTQILFDQMGAGQVTLTAGAGVTITAADAGLKSRVQYSVGGIIKVGTDLWLAFGDLSA